MAGNEFIDEYKYRCVITDSKGKQVISNEVWVDPPPEDDTDPVFPLEILKQPENAVANAGDEVGFGIAADGGVGEYTYTWQRSIKATNDWNDIEVEITTLGQQVIANIIASNDDFINNYVYRCIVTDEVGNEVISDIVYIEKKADPLEIISQPEEILECRVDDTYNLKVEVSGGVAPYSYQWQCTSNLLSGWVDLNENNSNETGYHSDTLILIVAASHLNYEYRYRCVITDSKGNTITSSETKFVIDNCKKFNKDCKVYLKK